MADTAKTRCTTEELRQYLVCLQDIKDLVLNLEKKMQLALPIGVVAQIEEDKVVVYDRVLHLSRRPDVKEVTKRSLVRSLKKLAPSRIEKALDRLSEEGFLKLETVRNKRGLPSIKIHLLK